MATVTGFTAERMEEMEAATIIDGDVVGDNLILTRHDTTTINAGNVRGPTGSPGVTQPELDTFMNDHLPIGSSVDYIGITSPSVKWILAIGQTIVNGQTLYPGFWAIIPASMKSGSSIIMPNMAGKVVVVYDATQTEFDTIIEIGGAKTHVLAQAELPAAPVSINPPSTTLSVDPPSTTVSINPPSTAVTGTVGDDNPDHQHAHFFGFPLVPKIVTTGTGAVETSANLPLGGSSYAVIPDPYTSGSTTRHQHPAGSLAVDIAPFNATVDIAPFNSSVDIAPFNSANLGSGTAHNNLQPYIVMQKLIKVL